MRLEEHVSYCSSCCNSLETCDNDDTLAGTVRQLAERPPDQLDREIEELITVLRVTPCPSVQIDDDDEPTDQQGCHEAASKLGWLGPFRIDDVIASGGMGVVLKGEDPHLQRPVAIKIMKPSIAARPDARRRFLCEARAMATLSDDHIIAIHQVGEHEGTPYFVMPMLTGQSLAERIANVPLEVEEAVRISKQVAAGLSIAHDSNILHKDIKPSNIWIEADTGRVKILDFGLSGDSDGNQIIGTPGYMSPEQARRDTLDQRSDLFSLGCVLYEALSGISPFRAINRNASLLAVHLREPRPLSQVNPLVSESLSQLVMQLIEKQAEDRIQSSAELLRQLEKCSLDANTQGIRSRQKRQIAVASLVLAIGMAVYSLWPDSSRSVQPVVYDVEAAPTGPWLEADAESVSAAIARQQQWAKDLRVPIIQENSVGMQMVLIPPGEFLMGSTDREIQAAIQVERSELAHSAAMRPNQQRYFIKKIEAEAPQHKVVLSKPFLIGRTEITVMQWNAFVDATGYVSSALQDSEQGGRTTFGLKESTPVAGTTAKTWVSWDEATQFCDWLSETEGVRYRLPTEAEWEYACRAGTTSKWFTGDDLTELAASAWTLQSCGRERQPRFNDAHVPVTEVATKRPNPFGLYDMTGNAWEWCSDWYSRSYYTDATPINPQGPIDTSSAIGTERETRVLRGGGNGFRENECRSASRWFYKPKTVRWYVGFRVVREIQ